jgi:hypothetical protein
MFKTLFTITVFITRPHSVIIFSDLIVIMAGITAMGDLTVRIGVISDLAMAGTVAAGAVEVLAEGMTGGADAVIETETDMIEIGIGTVVTGTAAIEIVATETKDRTVRQISLTGLSGLTSPDAVASRLARRH